MKTKKTIFFGTGGVAKGYCQNTGTLPDLFVDNDKNRWGELFEGVEVCNPEILSDIEIEKVVITSSYLKEIKPQVLKLGVPEELIVEPSKDNLQLFHQKSMN